MESKPPATTPLTEIDMIRALSDAVGAIAGELDLETVLQLIVDRVRSLVRARYAALGIVGADGSIERFITSGISPEDRARIGPPPVGHGLLGLIITEGRSLRIADIGQHPDSVGFPAHHPPMRALLGVPVRIKGRPTGNLYLTDRIDAAEFDPDDERLVGLFALHAEIAIENARLHETAARLAVVVERERIGMDLHDGIIQNLYGVSLSLEDVPTFMDEDRAHAAERVDAAIETINRTILELRSLILGLRPDLVARADLVGLLETLAEQLRQNALIHVELEVDDASLDLPPHARAELMQIAREALSNVVRHAAATQTLIRLSRHGDDVALEIRDNGRGFDVGRIGQEGHFGLANMHDRATAIGGSLEISSDPGHGTVVSANVPVTGSGPGVDDAAGEPGPLV